MSWHWFDFTWSQLKRKKNKNALLKKKTQFKDFLIYVTPSYREALKKNQSFNTLNLLSLLWSSWQRFSTFHSLFLSAHAPNSLCAIAVPNKLYAIILEACLSLFWPDPEGFVCGLPDTQSPPVNRTSQTAILSDRCRNSKGSHESSCIWAVVCSLSKWMHVGDSLVTSVV